VDQAEDPAEDLGVAGMLLEPDELAVERLQPFARLGNKVAHQFVQARLPDRPSETLDKAEQEVVVVTDLLSWKSSPSCNRRLARKLVCRLCFRVQKFDCEDAKFTREVYFEQDYINLVDEVRSDLAALTAIERFRLINTYKS
jgi:hypothetical protein